MSTVFYVYYAKCDYLCSLFMLIQRLLYIALYIHLYILSLINFHYYYIPELIPLYFTIRGNRAIN